MKATYAPVFTEVQIDILTRLIRNKRLKYSELKDEKVENDLFNYHLQHLVKKGLILKEESSYELSVKGKKVIANMDVLGNIRDLFRVSVALIVTRDNSGVFEILLQKRNRQPYLGDITSIAGKVLIGEKYEESAKRKLFEEAGLSGDFNLLGVKRAMRYNEKDEILEDILFHICYCHNPSGKLIEENEFGANFWGTFDEAIKAEKSNTGGSKSEVEILELIQKQKGISDLPFFYYQEKSIIKDY
ncbi:NUDIX domain-containing protein [Candidatus Dojkabacteria bacterium]|nr:NUDIX domain-containing protein [Candidatus Dojkabacteria bacterium]